MIARHGRHRQAPALRRGSDTRRRGFSLVELMVAIMILVIGVLGMAGTAAIITRQLNGGATQTIAASAAQARMEGLRGITCKDTSGSATARGITENYSMKRIGVGSPNATALLKDSLVFKLQKRLNRPQVYTSYRRCP